MILEVNFDLLESLDDLAQKIFECSVYNKNCPPVDPVKDTLMFLCYIGMYTTGYEVYSVCIHVYFSSTNKDTI